MELIHDIVEAPWGNDRLRIALIHGEIADFDELKKEVLDLVDANEGSDVTYEGHGTNWTQPFGTVIQYNLFNPHGRYHDSDVGGLSLQDKRFHESTRYPTLDRFIRSIPHCMNMRINILGPQSGLSQHQETIILRQPSDKYCLKVRFHLPIQTDRQAVVIVAGEVHQLKEGELYYFNNGCVHAARNLGTHPRIHLVFDAFLSTLVKDIFFMDYSPCSPDAHEPVDPDAPLDGNWVFDANELIDWFEPA